MQDIIAPPAPVTLFPERLGKAIALDDCSLPMVSQRISMLNAHNDGLCKPCAHFWKPEGCKNGSDCQFCHQCRPGELKARQKAKMKATRTAKVAEARDLKRQQHQEFSVGDRVRMRNSRQRWHDGVIATLQPLKVRFLDGNTGYAFDEVKKTQIEEVSDRPAFQLCLASFLPPAPVATFTEGSVDFPLMRGVPLGLAAK